MAANETYDDRLERTGFYSNCALEAVKAWFSGADIKVTRNKSQRLHLYWETRIGKYEFYAKGRSQRPYLQNFMYKGFIKRIS